MGEPTAGQRYTRDDGSAIRVDDVERGWVYFVQWSGDAAVGAPTRMTLDVFAEAVEKAEMKLEVSRGEG